ncbi:MAG: sodium:proton antiporter [Roseburia sp.]|nr:sodium:proton antiporter [Roseburia sp.]MCM1279645.1 sodium:proton antiporter [Robinsoniella sp.]
MGCILAKDLFSIPEICGYGLHFSFGGLRTIYVVIAFFMWAVTGVFSMEYMKHYANKKRYYVSFFITFLATVGIFLSADLFTLFIFFEIMSLTSYVWVAFDEKKEALRAGETYLAIAVIGGMVMLMGLFLFRAAGVSDMGIGNQGFLYGAGFCLLFGFLAKAGVFPLHIWLPKAHPVAPAPTSALLSGILTKTGIFGAIWVSVTIFRDNGDYGRGLLALAVITMVLGGILALNSHNLKEVLACSSVSQIGFILTGLATACILGEEGALAVKGTILHMVNHSLFKLVLFLVAGVVFMNLHKLDLNEIQGFGRKKPLLQFIYLMGALGIGGIPLFSGYISKTLLHEGLVEAGLTWAEWLFLLSGGITVAYMAKVYMLLFVEKNKDSSVQESYDKLAGAYMNKASAAVLTVSACLLPLFGILPGFTLDRVGNYGMEFFGMAPMEEIPHYFSLENLKGGFISIGIGIVIYFLVVRVLYKKQKGYGSFLPKWADLENKVYRPVISIICAVCTFICRILEGILDYFVVFLRKTIYRDRPLPYELTEGNEFTHAVGSFLDNVIVCFNKTIWKKHPRKEKNYEHRLAMFYTMIHENNTIITRSLSFGLMMFCTGLFIVLLYLLMV